MSKKNRKRKLEGEEQTMVDWEQENIFPNATKSEMESMWEIPQIFHFLHLAKEGLNIPHLSMYEMERMLLIPRASKQLANIMTSLLSSPITKAKLRKIPPMPYEFWTNILAHKVKSWFKVYEGKHRDAVKVLETVGVEPEFWNVFPDAPLLNGKDFEELTFKQRIWLLKTVCDTVMHTRKTVQEEIAKRPLEDQFETVVGTDRYGARYIYFPQFIKSDLRVYRHCLDNKILSTVKPIKPKPKVDLECKVKVENSSLRKKLKNRKRKSRWCNGSSSRIRKTVNKCGDKQSSDCKCSSDSATGSLMNEDTNMSSTSTCSNNNNNNNNDINLDTINGKRSRSLSKTSEISTASNETPCKSTKSSGYDTTDSIDKSCNKKSSQKMFKGFSSSSNSKGNIEIISGILNDLKSEINEGKAANDIDTATVHCSQRSLESNTKQYLDTTDSRVTVDESNDRSVDNLSSSSKTDDEKLNEIIGADNSKLNDKQPSSSSRSENEIPQISTTSKSDDEKLSETKTSSNCAEENRKDALSEDASGNRCVDNAEGMETEEKRKCKERNNEESNSLIADEKEVQSIKSKPNKGVDNSNTESNDEKDLSLSELRSLLQKEALEDFSYDEQSETGYNLRKVKDEKTDSWKQNVEDFNEMLLQLSVSKFELVADSVDSLRDLISSFSSKPENSSASSNHDDEPASPCEIKLVKGLADLLSSLEKVESSLRDSTKKARAKLQREWTSFKEGSVEDQDSSGEGGLGSNWWILGSQGCPLPIPGDATLQTLPQSALSPIGSQTLPDKRDDRQEEQSRRAEQSKQVEPEQETNQGDNAENKTPRGNETEEEHAEENASTGEEEARSQSKEEAEQQTRRVLRARGVSSYTEQLYSDDEVEEDELAEWADVEAVYAAPSTQTSASPPHPPPKIRHGDDWSDQEDSDQDWILPSSRKRKNKRPSAHRRLKSFQQKLQSIKIDTAQDPVVDSATLDPSNAKNDTAKPKVKETKVCRAKKPTDPQTSSINTIEKAVVDSVVENDPNQAVPSTELITCKVENVDSVHSELDIKDEGPIFDSVLNQYEDNYPTNLHPNYVMLKTDHNPMNYYVMQPNPGNIIPQSAIVQPGPVVSSIMPPIQQGYYVQGGQNYIIHNPQPSFIAPQQAFQPQGPQMMAPQQFISHSGYMPYMVSTTQSQPGCMPPPMPRGQIMTHETRANASIPPHGFTMPNRAPNRIPISRPNYPHPNGAVIRSSMPIRGHYPRGNNARSVKNISQQRAIPSKAQKPKKSVPPSENTGQKTTSLIVLSDSDDEIEMIITEKTGLDIEKEKSKASPRKNTAQPRQKPLVTSEVTVATPKGVISPQIIQRMSQGGISITPVKPVQPVQSSNTQLVVVVNETGSHYALALPNGSKLILTPEQVAQIRASNGGKLIL